MTHALQASWYDVRHRSSTTSRLGQPLQPLQPLHDTTTPRHTHFDQSHRSDLETHPQISSFICALLAEGRIANCVSEVWKKAVLPWLRIDLCWYDGRPPHSHYTTRVHFPLIPTHKRARAHTPSDIAAGCTRGTRRWPSRTFRGRLIHTYHAICRWSSFSGSSRRPLRIR